MPVSGAGLDTRLLTRLCNMPEPTFDEASQPIKTVFPAAKLSMDRAVEKWDKELASLTEEERNGLNRDRSCAVSLYTDLCKDQSSRDDRFYSKLNHLLNCQDWNGLQPYMKMLKLLSCALNQLSPAQSTGTYRVTQQRADHYEKDQIETFWGFTSTSLEMEEAAKFLSGDPDQPNTVFLCHTKSSRSIKTFSLHPEQEELLVAAGTAFRVHGKMQLDPMGYNNIVTIVEKESSPNCVLACAGTDFKMLDAAPLPPPMMPVFKVDGNVGAKPADKTWEDDWVPMLREDRKARDWKGCRTDGWDPCTEESARRPDGENSIDAGLAKRTKEVEWKVDHGWSQADAEAFTLLVASCAEPIARAMREQKDDYAASSHRLDEIFSRRVRAEETLREGTPPKPCYRNLSGKFGYATQFDEWKMLENKSDEQAKKLIGSSLRTIGSVQPPPPRCFSPLRTSSIHFPTCCLPIIGIAVHWQGDHRLHFPC